MKKYILLIFSAILMMFGSVNVYASIGASMNQAEFNSWCGVNFDKFNRPYEFSDNEVSINGSNSETTVCVKDVELPGKNGLNLNIVREYNSIPSIVRNSQSGEWIYDSGYFLTARYNLPGGEKKLIRFFSGDEYHQYGENGIYVSQEESESTTTQLHYTMTGGDVYLTRDTSYTPVWGEYDRTYKVRDFVYMDFGKNQIDLGYRWHISLGYFDTVIDSHSTGFVNQYERTRLFRLGNGISFCVVEEFRATNTTISEYKTKINSMKGYEVITPYAGMANEDIVDTEKGITYFYSLKDKSGNVWYYRSTGEIVAESDRYGNMIKYAYTDNDVTITDTMGRVVTIDKVNKKVLLTAGGITEDIVYYDNSSKNARSDDYDDYYTDYIFKVIKPENGESKQNCKNITEYTMKQRSNWYNSSQSLVPHIEHTYLIDSISKPDGARLEYEYSDVEISNTANYPMREHFVSQSKGVSADNVTYNLFEYSYSPETKNSSSSYKYTVTRADGLTVIYEYDKTDRFLISKKTVGQSINENEMYSYHDKKYNFIESILTEKYDASTDELKFDTMVKYDYDDRDNVIKENNMGRVTEYDYGTVEGNPYNILLTCTVNNDNQIIKTVNTINDDKKNIADSKIYATENSSETLKKHTSYEYDSYGNISKITERPSSSVAVNNIITYTYDLPCYTVEKYVQNVNQCDNSTVDKISTFEEYDKYGNLKEFTDGEGNKTTYTYDRLGRLLTVTNPDNTSKTYVYDIENNCVTATNENGTTVKQDFDLYGREKSLNVLNPLTDQYVKLQEYTYNTADGNVQSVMSLGAGNNEKIDVYNWDDSGRIISKLTKTKNSSGTYDTADSNTYTYENIHGTPQYLHVDNDTSATEKPSYNFYGYGQYSTFTLNRQYEYFIMDVTVNYRTFYIYTVDEEGTEKLVCSYPYGKGKQTFRLSTKDVYKLKVGVSDVKSNNSNISNIRAYTKSDIDAAREKMISVNAGDNSITPAKIEQTYDIWGNMVEKRSIDAESAAVLTEEIWTYDQLGNNLTYRNPVSKTLNTNTYEKTYDYAGNVLTEKINDNKFGSRTTVNMYDNAGRLVSANNSKNNYTYEYDKLGRVIWEKHCSNGGVSYKYDKNGNVIRKQETVQSYDSESMSFNTTDYEYDNRNRLIKATQYKIGTTQPQITQYYYDACGNILRMYTGLNSPLVINGLDDVTNGADSDYSVTKYEYDFMNRLVKTTDPLNQVETMTYDFLGNMLTKTDRNGNIITYTYNWLSKPLAVSSSSDNKTNSYTYDNLGNVTGMTDETGTTSYTYDALSRLVSAVKGSIAKTYSYNQNGARTSFGLFDNDVNLMNLSYVVSNTDTLYSVSDGTDITVYDYDIAGNLLSEHTGSISSEYTYNASNYIDTVLNSVDNTQKSFFVYSRQKNGNITNVVSTYSDGAPQPAVYSYDGMGRLTWESRLSSQINNAFSYDDNGNRTEISGKTAYDYDKNNRLITESGDIGAAYQYDNNGNLYSKAGFTLTEASDNPETVNISASPDGYRLFTHDGFNRLTAVSDGNNTYSYEYDGNNRRTAKVINNTRTEYIWDGDCVVAEKTNGITTVYVRGTKLHYAKTGDTKLYYLYNAHGDVIQTVNSEGVVADEYLYDAFGNQINDTVSSNPFRYCGEYQDLCSGLIYLRNRYYDPSIGRFISEDPAKDGANWYAYCANDPVNRIDPTGTTWTYFDSFLPDWAQNRIEQLTADYYAAGDSLNQYGGYVRNDIHNEAFNLRMQFLDNKWVKYAIIDIADAGITENNYHQFIYETNMTYYQMVYEYAITLQDMKSQGGEMPRDRNGHIANWFLKMVGGSIAPGSNFKNAIDDYNNNPDNWKKTNESIQNSTNVRNKGGRSIEQEFTNKNTGQKIYRHTLEKSDGSLFEQPHFRPYPKQLK